MIYSITLEKKRKIGKPKKVTLREFSKRRLEANIMQKLKEGYTKVAKVKYIKKEDKGTPVSSTLKMTAAGGLAGGAKYTKDMYNIAYGAGKKYDFTTAAGKDFMKMKSKGGIRDTFAKKFMDKDTAENIRQTYNAKIFNKGFLRAAKKPALVGGLVGLGFGIHREFKRKNKK